jgi:hypothetical protein
MTWPSSAAGTLSQSAKHAPKHGMTDEDEVITQVEAWKQAKRLRLRKRH